MQTLRYHTEKKCTPTSSEKDKLQRNLKVMIRTVKDSKACDNIQISFPYAENSRPGTLKEALQ